VGQNMRREDWPEVLHAEIEAARDKPFVWGACDCCLWAADVVKALTGMDYAAEFRGRYSTARGAVRALKRYGKGTLDATMDALLPRRPFPMRGDVVMAIVDGQQALGICVDVRAAFKAPQGLTFLPLSEIAAAWAVD